MKRTHILMGLSTEATELKQDGQKLDIRKLQAFWWDYTVVGKLLKRISERIYFTISER